MSGLIQFEVNIDRSELEAATRRLFRTLDDPREVFDEVGEYLDAETQQRFQDGVDPDGSPWPPSQRAEAEGGKTLVDHGHLRDSYQYFASRDALVFGSNMAYAAIQHFGGQAGRGRAVTLPPRPALGVNDRDADEIVTMFEREMRRAWSGGVSS